MAYEKGILLCGLSAGLICWFEYGQSEIKSETSEDGYPTAEPERKAYKIYSAGEQVIKAEIRQVNGFKDKDEIYK